MATRTNACSELARFWLEARHGCLVTEGVPVKVPYGHSDIDLLALQPLSKSIQLPNGMSVGPRLIVEAKDEHDWEPTGREFGQLLRADMTMMGSGRFIPTGSKGVKFSMLRERHYRQATALFGSDDFDRLVVVHAIDADVLADLGPALAERRIAWVTIPAVVGDLIAWYRAYEHPTALRNTLVGDLFHLLVGFCGLSLPVSAARQ